MGWALSLFFTSRMIRCSCSNFNIPGWRWLPACRPYCLTAKQVAPNHESIRDDGRSAGLEVLARPLGLEFLCPFSNFKMHKAHSVWAGGRSMCVGTGQTQSSILTPEAGELKKKAVFSCRFERAFCAAFHLGIEPGKFSHPRPRSALSCFL